MNRCTMIFFWVSVAPWSAAGADESTVVQQSGPATLWTTNPLEKNVIVLPFTDELTLLIDVKGGAGLEVQPPDAWTKSPWQARLAGPPVRKENADRVRWTQTLLVEPQTPGESSLTLAPLKFRESPDDDWRSITWQPIAVRVTTKLTQPDLKSARDITAIEELPARPPPKTQIELIVMIVGGAFLVVLLLGAWRVRRKTSHTRGSPEAWALYELSRLQALRLPEQGKHERFGTLLANLLRRYLEKKHQLPVRRQTTGEILAALPQYPALADQRPFLEAFLRRCDLLKFAPVDSTADECRALAEQVRQFIGQAKVYPPRGVNAQRG
jgi:hypothetical protein